SWARDSLKNSTSGRSSRSYACAVFQWLRKPLSRWPTRASISARTRPIWSWIMKVTRRALGAPELLILVGSCLFIFVLWLSAYFEPDIRSLHFFQAWKYLAAIGLSLRRVRWGYFIGLSAAG